MIVTLKQSHSVPTLWMGEQPGRLHSQPQAAGSTAWPTAYLGTGTAVLA